MRPLRRRQPGEGPEGSEPDVVEIDPSSLAGIFAAPGWLRDTGLTAWLLVGVGAAVVGLVWLLSLTETIVLPVITASIVAAVASPVVARLKLHRVPRAAGTALVMLAIIAVGVLLFLVVLAGITSELSTMGDQLSSAVDKISGWLKDVGVDTSTADGAKQQASDTATASVSALLSGVAGGIATLSSLLFFLALTALSLFFLLKDGPTIRAWGERSLGIPLDLARTISQRMLGALRGYFLGVTIVAAFNAVVVGIGSLILGVPLVGTIVVVTFLGAYIPYLGAWGAGAFAVLMALGGAGPDAALGMAVVQLLANGILQQMVQPFAMGAALGIHPLAVLIVTIAGGALFGAIGLILAAPVTSAVTKIAADVSRAREETDAETASPAAPEPA